MWPSSANYSGREGIYNPAANTIGEIPSAISWVPNCRRYIHKNLYEFRQAGERSLRGERAAPDAKSNVVISGAICQRAVSRLIMRWAIPLLNMSACFGRQRFWLPSPNPSGEVVGIERDTRSIARARVRVAEAGLHNVTFTQSSSRHWPWPTCPGSWFRGW